MLFGSVLLLICMQMRCFPLGPKGVSALELFEYYDSSAMAYQSWLAFSIVARFPIVLAGAAGLFICFWPGGNPVRRILLFVCLPALGGIAALCGRFLYVGGFSDFARVSVLQGHAHNDAWAFTTIWSLGPALHMSVLGIALVLIFLTRMVLGKADLPLALSPTAELAESEQSAWKRIQILIWISIVGVYALGFAVGALVQAVYGMILHFDNHRWLAASAHLEGALVIALLGGIAAWAAGENRWKELRQFTKIPTTQFGMLGFIFPTAVNLVPSIMFYLHDRVHWARVEFGRFSPPLLSSYFRIPELFFFWNLPAAAFEEIIWRGYLQPRFIRRFGILKGIFLLGLVWSAFHFLGDFRGTSEDYQVPIHLLTRLWFCVTMGYVFGWLTLRSGSIWPAALAHGMQDVWPFSNSVLFQGQDRIVARIIAAVCWGVLAFALFRWWPLARTQDLPAPSSGAPAELLS